MTRDHFYEARDRWCSAEPVQEVDANVGFPPDHQPAFSCLAMILGVRRAGVTVAASGLRRAGRINYKRGSVTIIERRGLEQRSCECYGVSKREFDRLLGAD